MMREEKMQIKKALTIRKKPRPGGKYIIKIDGKITWEGSDPQSKLPRILSDYRDKNVSISWKPDREFLIV